MEQRYTGRGRHKEIGMRFWSIRGRGGQERGYREEGIRLWSIGEGYGGMRGLCLEEYMAVGKR